MKLSIHFGAVILALASGPHLQAGSLNPPPGPVAPTNRMTLDAQSIVLPYTISQSGSYVFTSNFTGLPGQNGIVIAASNVTLDLNGFTLSGLGANGVQIDGARSNITIHNGAITGWSASAINGGTASQCNVRDLIVSSSPTGVVVGSSWFVSGLNISSASSVGLRVLGTNNRIESCHVSNCGTGFQVLGTGNLILRTSAGGGNATDFDIAAGNSHGPIVNVGGVGDISLIGGANHPWANFATSCLIATEVCDGLDNDCNNQVDESDPQIGLPCTTGLQGECGFGERTCSGGALVCEQTQFPVPETCNGLDDDCDGAIDDGNPCPVGNCISGSCG